jgi:hypothetical protein
MLAKKIIPVSVGNRTKDKLLVKRRNCLSIKTTFRKKLLENCTHMWCVA